MELRECPFCGGKACLEDMGYPHHVYCVECGARVAGKGYHTDGERDAAEKWNRRHVPAIPEPFTPTPIDPVAQHHPCNDCPFDPATCKTEDCERLKRYEAARKEENK